MILRRRITFREEKSLGMRDRGIDWGAVAMATIVMLVEGYDLVIYGSTLPIMLKESSLGLTVGVAGIVGSAVFFGMLFGGLSVGTLAHHLGLRAMLTVGICCFSISMVGAALIHEPWLFCMLRFLAGWGLGAVMPTCMAMTRQSSTTRLGPLAISTVMAGIPLGGMVASLFTYVGVATMGWRGLFVVGALLGVLLLPFVAAFARRVANNSEGSSQRQARKIPQPLWIIVLVGCLATFCFLLTYYGLVTWLTQLMTELRVPLSGALQLALVLNVGGAVGSVAIGVVAMRFGSLRTLVCAGVVSVAMLVLIPSGAVSGTGLMVVVTVLGMVAPATQNLVNAIIAESVPAENRAASLGKTLGVGRVGAIAAPLLGSWLLASVPKGTGLTGGAGLVFVAFACTCLVGVGAALLFPFGARRAQAVKVESGR